MLHVITSSSQISTIIYVAIDLGLIIVFLVICRHFYVHRYGRRIVEIGNYHIEEVWPL